MKPKVTGFTKAEFNSLGYLPPSETPSVIIEPSKVGMNAMGYLPDSKARQDDGRFDGDVVYAEEPGLGKWSIRKPLGGKKSVFRQVTNVVTAPVKLAALPVLQAVGLKTVAKELNDGLMRQKDLVAAGKIVQVAGAVAGAVVAAPVIAGAVSSAASYVGSSELGKAVIAQTVKGLYGNLTTPKGAKQDSSGNPVDNSGAPIDAQKWYDLGVADAKNGKGRGTISGTSEQAYYNQGYDDMQKLLAEQAPAVPPTNITVNPATETPATPSGVIGQPAYYQPSAQSPVTYYSSPTTGQTVVGGSEAFIPGGEGPMSLKDAPISKASGGLIPEEFKPYLPYAIGGLSLIILLKVLSPGAAPVAANANPHRRWA